MTREEAIEKLHWFALDNRDKQIIDMAIEALTSQNLTEPNNTCEVDLISRADAIELCAEAQGRASTKSELKGISKVWQGLLKLPSAESVPIVDLTDGKTKLKAEDWVYDTAPSAEAEWIPCSERLPSEDGCYLVCMDWEYDNMNVLRWADGWNCHRGYDGKISRESEIDGEDIVAWMPLPKPYREDGE